MNPRMSGFGPRTGPVVLFLHGGEADSHRRPGLLAYLLLLPFAWAVRRRGLAVRLLRYRFRGWNGTAADPVRDVRWALDRIGPRPVLLVGHSMGGRAALYAGGDPGVLGVCALAPWIEPADPWTQLRDRPLLIVHGARDQVTDPAVSRAFAERLGARFELLDDTHAMLRRYRNWVALVREFAVRESGVEPH